MERDQKALARTKRAASQRLKARHSHSKQGHAGATSARDAGTPESLPSNWERYANENESQTPAVDGLVLPQSKGADYAELISSVTPKLFEDHQVAGMNVFMLEKGIGLWDWDTSVLKTTNEHQTSKDAAALLSVDLVSLGKSLAHLAVAERFFLEKELLPEETFMEAETESDSRKVDNALTNAELDEIIVSPPSSLAGSSLFHDGFHKSVSQESLIHPADSPGIVEVHPSEAVGNIFRDRMPITGSNTEQEDEIGERKQLQSMIGLALPKQLEAVEAEAELDLLLDSLDNFGISDKAETSSGTVPEDLLRGSFLDPLSTNLQPSPASGKLWDQYSRTSHVQEQHRRAPCFNSSCPAQPMASSKSLHDSKEALADRNPVDDFDSWLDSL